MRWPKLVKGFTQSTPITAMIDADGLDEDGAPIVGASWSGSCNYQDHIVETYTKDKAETEVRASLYVDGDPVPQLSIIGGGEVSVFGESRTIVMGMKARNPDGSVNYTRFDLK